MVMASPPRSHLNSLTRYLPPVHDTPVHDTLMSNFSDSLGSDLPDGVAGDLFNTIRGDLARHHLFADYPDI